MLFNVPSLVEKGAWIELNDPNKGGANWRGLRDPRIIDAISVHHSVTNPTGNWESEVATIWQIHKANGWGGIGYNIVVTTDEVDGYAKAVLIGDLASIRAHTPNTKGAFGLRAGYGNEYLIGICMVGQLHIHNPTDAQMRTMHEIIKELLYNENERLPLLGEWWDMHPHKAFDPTQCFPMDTELLTPSGWKTIADIVVGDMVASAHIDDLSIEFQPVLNKVEPKVQDYYTARDLSLTKDHRVMFSTQTSLEQNRVFSWGEALRQSGQIYVPNAGYHQGEGLPISEEELELLIAIQADGHYMKDKEHPDRPYGVMFHLSKQRKIEAISDLLNTLEIEFNSRVSKDGTTYICIYGQPILQFAEKYLSGKKFTWEFLNLSPSQAEFFIQKVQLYDGCTANQSYSSSIKQNVDIVSAIAAINGVGARGEDARVYFRGRYRTIPLLTDIKRVSGKQVSCVTVPSGFILIRQQGRTTIVGNCSGRWDEYQRDKIINPPLLDNGQNEIERLKQKYEDIIKLLEEKIMTLEGSVGGLQADKLKLENSIKDIRISHEEAMHRLQQEAAKRIEEKNVFIEQLDAQLRVALSKNTPVDKWTLGEHFYHLLSKVKKIAKSKIDAIKEVIR